MPTASDTLRSTVLIFWAGVVHIEGLYSYRSHDITAKGHTFCPDAASDLHTENLLIDDQGAVAASSAQRLQSPGGPRHGVSCWDLPNTPTFTFLTSIVRSVLGSFHSF